MGAKMMRKAAEISQRDKSQSRNSPRKDVAAMAKARDQKKTMTKKTGQRAHSNGTLSGRRTSTQRTSEERATRRTRRVARARDPATKTMMRLKEVAPKMAKERDQKMAKERDQKMAKKAKERDQPMV